MARSRNIKPSFFINEDLVELPFSTRLLFIGLWTLADREGRLTDRPKTIKMALFPADDVDVDAGLTELADRKLIIRYVVEDERFIQVVNFAKHQNPHVKEAPSSIPAPDGHGADTIPATLIPDSLLLIPDSPLPGSDASTGKKPKSASRSKKQPKAETTIPADFALTAAMREWAKGKVPRLNLDHEFELFVERCKAKGTVYKDWVAGWRTQMLNAQKWADEKSGVPSNKVPNAVVSFKPAIHRPDIIPVEVDDTKELVTWRNFKNNEAH